MSKRETTVIDTELAPFFYVNNVSVKTSLWDVTLELERIVDLTDERLTARRVATIAMSPQHAQALAAMLTRQIARYERDFGRLPRLPDEAEED